VRPGQRGAAVSRTWSRVVRPGYRNFGKNLSQVKLVLSKFVVGKLVVNTCRCNRVIGTLVVGTLVMGSLPPQTCRGQLAADASALTVSTVAGYSLVSDLSEFPDRHIVWPPGDRSMFDLEGPPGTDRSPPRGLLMTTVPKAECWTGLGSLPRADGEE
jgi:hypothetical protein